MPLPKTINDHDQYEITLAAPVTVGRRTLQPRLTHVVSGKVLKQIKDDVTDGRKIAD